MSAEPEMVERVARAIATADEQNGGPPWDFILTMGKHVIGPAFDRGRAAIEAIEAAGFVILPRAAADMMAEVWRKQ